MRKFTNTPSQALTLDILADNNITPKKSFPFIWKVGNKNLTVSEIENLLEMAKLREADFIARMEARLEND